MKERDLDPVVADRLLQSNWGIKAEETDFVALGDSTLNWVISAADGNVYVLRNAGNFEQYVRFQCDVLNHLTETGFPYQVPQPLRTGQGEFVVDTESGSYFVYPFIPGNTPTELDQTKSVDIGRMLATYHQYIKGFNWESRPQLRSKNLFETDVFIGFIQKCESTVSGKKVKSDADLAYLDRFDRFRSFYGETVSSVDTDYYNSLSKIACHGDFERRNIIVQGDKIVGFVDLGGVTIDPRICDLQSCIQLNSTENGRLNMKTANGIIEGYAGVIRPEERERKLILPLMYTEMLKTLSWVLSERTKPDTRVELVEATSRLDALSWIMENYSDIQEYLESLTYK